MSRIGNSIINIPEGVALEVKENIITAIKGNKSSFLNINILQLI